MTREFLLLMVYGKREIPGLLVLKKVPQEFIHQPHKMNIDKKTLYDVEIGNSYPEPMINLDDSYEEIKERDKKPHFSIY